MITCLRQIISCHEKHKLKIFFNFSVSRFYEVTYKRDFHLQIQHSGNIRWSFGGIFTTSCDIDLSFYPFDHQYCSIELESWQYPKDKLMLELYPVQPVNLAGADDDPQWVLKGGSVSYNDDRLDNLNFINPVIL